MRRLPCPVPDGLRRCETCPSWLRGLRREDSTQRGGPGVRHQVALQSELPCLSIIEQDCSIISSEGHCFNISNVFVLLVQSRARFGFIEQIHSLYQSPGKDQSILNAETGS